MAELRLPKADYDFESLVRMAHRVGHFFSIAVIGEGHEWVLRWDIAEDLSEESVKRVRNEIYDQVLRDRIHADTKPIRDLIFAAAFSNLELK